jgi:hypothetical protein
MSSLPKGFAKISKTPSLNALKSLKYYKGAPLAATHRAQWIERIQKPFENITNLPWGANPMALF